jgi:protein TonB
LSLKRFFIYSFSLHVLLIIVVIAYKPALPIKEPPGVFITRLIAPDDFPIHHAPPPSLPQRSAPLKQNIPSVPTPKTEKRSNVIPEKGMGEEAVPSPSLPPAPPVPSPSSPSQGRIGTLEGENTIQKPAKPQYLPREKLFDRNIIGDLAKRDIEREKNEREKMQGKGRSLTFDTKDYKFLLYNERLKERIESIWIYPHDAATRGIYGDLIIRFTIKKNGTLGAIELVRTSGHQNLDEAAMKALKDGEPYWPLPEEWGMDAYTIVGHFVYTIYGYYIR